MISPFQYWLPVELPANKLQRTSALLSPQPFVLLSTNLFTQTCYLNGMLRHQRPSNAPYTPRRRPQTYRDIFDACPARNECASNLDGWGETLDLSCHIPAAPFGIALAHLRIILCLRSKETASASLRLPARQQDLPKHIQPPLKDAPDALVAVVARVRSASLSCRL